LVSDDIIQQVSKNCFALESALPEMFGLGICDGLVLNGTLTLSILNIMVVFMADVSCIRHCFI
jgi:hypothetical protein